MGRRRKRERKRANEESKLVRRARGRANHRVAFAGHVVVALAVTGLLMIVAPTAAVIVAMSWGVLIAAHGFFFVAAPVLRERWMADELEQQVHEGVVDDRRLRGEAQAQSMQRLSASVAHEIRNPITAAKSLVQQIGEDPTSTDNVEYARVAVEELDRVERAVAHLLRFAREEGLRLEQLQLSDVVQEALDSFGDRIEHVRVDWRVEDNALRADRDKLRRVVVNLVGNALEAFEEADTPDPTIVITSGRNLAGTEIWFRVADNGPGIDPTVVDQVFDPFHSTKAEGTGLGLAITRKLVDAHGGSIEVNGSHHPGAELIVTLPVTGTTT